MSSARWPHGPGCRVCVSLAPARRAELLQRLASLDEGELAGAELVEVRLDALDDALDDHLFAELVAACPVPLGFTLRPAWHGGGYHGDEQARRAILERAAAARPGFVDVELTAEWAADFVAATPAPVVLSHHWYEPGVPADLEERVAQALAIGPALVKLVATAASPDDAAALLRAGARLAEAGQPAACFCMGEPGRSSRLLAAARHAGLIYAAPVSGAEVAPGQWTVRTLVDELGLPHWRPQPRLYGLIGHPIGHSLSPLIFNAVFRDRDTGAAYVPLIGEDVDAVLRLAAAAQVGGVSVTMPFKQEMARRCARRDAIVAATGAANTVLFDDQGWSAHNTDGPAVVEALQAVTELADKRVALLGAGGAAAAAAAGLAGAGADVTVLNRTPERAAHVAALAAGSCGAVEQLESTRYEVIINATPVGMAGTPHAQETPFPISWLRGDEVVFDMVYRPLVTPLLRGAAAAGCPVIGGLEMFVRQAAAQYRLLTGDAGESPLALMHETATEVVGQDA